jgi:hypothetical protein
VLSAAQNVNACVSRWAGLIAAEAADYVDFKEGLLRLLPSNAGAERDLIGVAPVSEAVLDSYIDAAPASAAALGHHGSAHVGAYQ